MRNGVDPATARRDTRDANRLLTATLETRDCNRPAHNSEVPGYVPAARLLIADGFSILGSAI